MHTHTHVRAHTQKTLTTDSYQPPDKVLSCQGCNIFSGGSPFLLWLGGGSQGFGAGAQLWQVQLYQATCISNSVLCPPGTVSSCPNLLYALLTVPLGTQWDLQIFKQQPSLLPCLFNSALLKRLIQVAPKMTQVRVISQLQSLVSCRCQSPLAFVLQVGGYLCGSFHRSLYGQGVLWLQNVELFCCSWCNKSILEPFFVSFHPTEFWTCRTWTPEWVNLVSDITLIP